VSTLSQHANTSTISDILIAIRRRLVWATGIHPSYVFIGAIPYKFHDVSAHTLHVVIEQQTYSESSNYAGPFINIANLRGHVMVRSRSSLDPVGHDIYKLLGMDSHIRYVELVAAHLHLFWPYKEVSDLGNQYKLPLTLQPMRVVGISGPKAPDQVDRLFVESHVVWEAAYLPKLPPTALVSDSNIEGWPLGAYDVGSSIIEWNLV